MQQSLTKSAVWLVFAVVATVAAIVTITINKYIYIMHNTTTIPAAAAAANVHTQHNQNTRNNHTHHQRKNIHTLTHSIRCGRAPQNSPPIAVCSNTVANSRPEHSHSHSLTIHISPQMHTHTRQQQLQARHCAPFARARLQNQLQICGRIQRTHILLYAHILWPTLRVDTPNDTQTHTHTRGELLVNNDLHCVDRTERQRESESYINACVLFGHVSAAAAAFDMV